MSNWTEAPENRKKAKKDVKGDIETFYIPTSDYTKSSVKYTIQKYQIA